MNNVLVTAALLLVGATGLHAQAAFRLDRIDPDIVSISPDRRYTLRIANGTEGRVLLQTAGAADKVIIDLQTAPLDLVWSLDTREIAIGIADSSRGSRTEVVRLSDGLHHAIDINGRPMGFTKSGELLISVPGVAGESGSLALVSPSGAVTTLYEFGGLAAIVADGTRYYGNERGKLVEVTRATGLRGTLTATAANEDMPLLSPDGRTIVFASDKDGSWALYAASLATLPIRNAVKLGDLEGKPSKRAFWWTTDDMLGLRTRSDVNAVYHVKVPGNARRPRVPLSFFP